MWLESLQRLSFVELLQFGLLKRLVKGPSKESFGLDAAAQRHLLLWVKVRGKSAGKE